MSETKLSIAALGTRENVVQVTAAVPITGAAGALGSVQVTFDKAFVNAPKIVGFGNDSIDLAKSICSVSTLTASSMYVNIWREALANLANGTYTVKVNVVGERSV